MKRRNRAQLRATAFHEAGHAVAAFRERIPLVRVTIAAGDGYDGETIPARGRGRSMREHEDVTPYQTLRLLALVRFSLAGGIAQRRAAPRSMRSHHAEEDRRRAINGVSLALGVDGTVLEAYVHAVRVQTEAMLNGPWWNAVEALAAALLEENTLRGEEAESIIRRALRPTDTNREKKGEG